MGKDQNRIPLPCYKSPCSEKGCFAYYPQIYLQSTLPIPKKGKFYYFSVCETVLKRFIQQEQKMSSVTYLPLFLCIDSMLSLKSLGLLQFLYLLVMEGTLQINILHVI